MIDRQKLEAILSRRFPGATHLQIAAAANAIMGLADERQLVRGGESADAAADNRDAAPFRRTADGASFDVSTTSSQHDAPDSDKGPPPAAK